MGQRKISLKKKRKSEKKRLLIGGVVAGGALLIILIVCAFLGAAVNKVPDNVICDNVYIDEVNVSGMTAKEAKKHWRASRKSIKKQS